MGFTHDILRRLLLKEKSMSNSPFLIKVGTIHILFYKHKYSETVKYFVLEKQLKNHLEIGPSSAPDGVYTLDFYIVM